jgi:hypothetical protein
LWKPLVLLNSAETYLIRIEVLPARQISDADLAQMSQLPGG